MSSHVDVAALLKTLGIEALNAGAHDGKQSLKTEGAGTIASHNPSTGELIAEVAQADEAVYEQVVARAHEGFLKWRKLPAPARGEVVRQIGGVLRENKQALGELVSLENGKILTEGLGEVQEMIDICDFAVGLSRQLYGLSMHSERPSHRMYEQWHPLGIAGTISAFNFPVAVWSWNAMIAAVCGDATVWKPSSKTPLTAIAVQKLIEPVVAEHDCEGIFSLVVGRGSVIGERILNDRRIPLVSATGSCRMGKRVAEVVNGRMGRTILELGGNNGIIAMADADLDMTLMAVLFGAVGTAGQRCTSTRRLFLQEGIHDEFLERLTRAYASVRIGDPLDESTLMGPLIDEGAVDDMMAAIAAAKEQGGELVCGGSRIDRPGSFVEPTIMKASTKLPIVREETFAPILYVSSFKDLDEAIALHNSVDQGLSSAIFTTNLQSAERFLSTAGSDCGIANVNIGTSGAEIGGAFGGEKDTGGGREAGSDAWKLYMRRQTCTINYSNDLPLAQGVHFDI